MTDTRVVARRFPVSPSRRVVARRGAACAFESLEARRLLAVVINEFVASNTDGLTDQDGQRSDWLELRNTGASPVNLGGWYLTDDNLNLTKWQFPSTNLSAGGYLVVFASDKDRAVAGDELHTNFKLSSAGGYLALVQSDGTTIESSIANYPPQKADISYGNAVNTATSASETLVSASTPLRVISPTAENASVDDHWREIVFPAESTWKSGVRSIGFDRDGTAPDFTSFIGTTLSTTDMPSSGTIRTTAYVRYAFDLADKDQLSALTLTMRFDDGFIAYINNKKVRSVNFGEPFTNPQPSWNSAAGNMLRVSTALVGVNRTSEATTPVEFDVTPYLSGLVNGTNVLAFHAVNTSSTSTLPGAGKDDFLLEPVLTAIRATAPAAEYYMPAPTPGASNGLGTLSFVSDTHFSVDRGFFDVPSFPLEITTTTDGAEIRYTFDGSEPTASNGTVYAGPITITKPASGNRGVVTVRAAAFKPGYTPSNVDTQSYVFLDRVIQQGTLGLPAAATWGHNKTGSLDDTKSGYNLFNEADWAMDPNIVTNPNWSATIINDLMSIPSMSVVMNWDDLFGGTPQPGTPNGTAGAPGTGSVPPTPQGIYIHGRGEERAASIEYFNSNAIGDQFQIDGAIEIQGHTSGQRWKADKLSLQLTFKDPYGPKSLSYPLYTGTPYGANAATQFDGLILDAGHNYTWIQATASQNDAARIITDQVIADLQNAASGDGAPHGKWVHLYLNGLYWGIYNLHERPDDGFAKAYFGGSKNDYDVVKHASDKPNRKWTYVEGGIAAEESFQTLIGLAEAGNFATVQNQLDIDDFIDYMIVHVYGGNTRDWPDNNWYATRNRVEPGAKWHFHEWDQEHAISPTAGNNVNATGGDLLERPPLRIHVGLMTNVEYKQRFNDRVQKLLRNNGLLTQASATAIYNARRMEIDRAIVGESARWGDNRMNSTSKRYTRDNWVATMDGVTNPSSGFFANRTSNVLSYLSSWLLSTAAPNFDAGNPNFNYGGTVPPGTLLTMTNPGAGTIYYTTDGSDPRLSGGAINSPAAQPYGGAIEINSSTRIRARVRNGSSWSPEIDATYNVGGSYPVRITELNYHPPNYPGVTDDEDVEFFELLNTGNATVSLQGLQIAGFAGTPYVFGSGLTLAAGERIIVARNPSVFQSIYGSGFNVAPNGYGTQNLSNGGELVTLISSLGDTLQSFVYDDEAPWPTSPDGNGPTLEVIDPLGDPANPANWRASLANGGSPGTDGLPTAIDAHWRDVIVQFPADLSGTIVAGDLQITPVGGGSAITPTSIAFHAPSKTATFTTTNALPDGDYTGVLHINGSDYTISFFILTADANHDGHVDSLDFTALAASFNQNGGVTYANGDFNQDGVVNALDFNALASKWGITMPSAPAPAPLLAASKMLPSLFGDARIESDDFDALLGDESHAL